jgi:hypothetical protein
MQWHKCKALPNCADIQDVTSTFLPPHLTCALHSLQCDHHNIAPTTRHNPPHPPTIAPNLPRADKVLSPRPIPGPIVPNDSHNIVVCEEHSAPKLAPLHRANRPGPRYRTPLPPPFRHPKPPPHQHPSRARAPTRHLLCVPRTAIYTKVRDVGRGEGRAGTRSWCRR